MRWIKRIFIGLLVLVLLIAGFALMIRYQGFQYLSAYTLGGFNNPLPAVDAYPVTVAGGTNPCASGPISVISYNIFNGSALVEDLVDRFAEGDLQGMRPWSERVPEIKARIGGYDPDIIGFQEMVGDADIWEAIPDREVYGLITQHFGPLEYGDAAILYRKARFELLDFGHFTLGPNPDLPFSYGFIRASMLRYVNWALLREKETGFTFLFVNTHFDNNTPNKEPSSPLFQERVAKLAQGLPMIVTGDFNSKGNTDRYATFTGAGMNPPLLVNAYSLDDAPAVFPPTGPKRPIAETEPELHYLERIDHILVGGPCEEIVEEWLIDLRPLSNGEPMSDHDLLAAKIQFAAPAAAP
jgi:endonuclease/exonuclease/phosphatase family metal-dependent hydrolase